MLHEFQQAITIDNSRKLKAAVASNADLQNIILKATPKAIQQTKAIAQKFNKGTVADSAAALHNFVRKNFLYQKDTPGTGQQIIQPSYLLNTLTGDCKSFSLFIFSILYNLGYNVSYKLAGYSKKKRYPHTSIVLLLMSMVILLCVMVLALCLIMKGSLQFLILKNISL
jgi:hypothetical protein